jgi:hypothetical protein
MEKPATHSPPTIEPTSPIPCLDDLPPQMRQEALSVLVAMLLAHHRRTETDDERRH